MNPTVDYPQQTSCDTEKPTIARPISQLRLPPYHYRMHRHRLKYGHSKPSSHLNEQLKSTGSDGTSEHNELSFPCCTTGFIPESGQRVQWTGEPLSISCQEALLGQRGMILDMEVKLLFARTFLARRGVPKQDIPRLLYLAHLSECNSYKELRQRLKSLSFLYAYSAGSMQTLLDVKHGSNSGSRAVYSD